MKPRLSKDKPCQGNAREGKARQGRTGQGKARQGKASHVNLLRLRRRRLIETPLEADRRRGGSGGWGGIKQGERLATHALQRLLALVPCACYGQEYMDSVRSCTCLQPLFYYQVPMYQVPYVCTGNCEHAGVFRMQQQQQQQQPAAAASSAEIIWTIRSSIFNFQFQSRFVRRIRLRVCRAWLSVRIPAQLTRQVDQSSRQPVHHPPILLPMILPPSHLDCHGCCWQALRT